MKKKINSLYIHIPFCKRICPYCDFTKFILDQKYISLYIIELKKDLELIKKKGFKFKTIYIGGGTPSILTLADLEEILIILKELLDENYEFTIEVNPENINESLLRLLSRYGINRISIGIQSFNKKMLQNINRDYELDIFKLINLVKKYILNINVDLIYGLIDETFDILKEDVDKILSLEIPHISTYSLIIDGPSLYNIKGYKERSDETLRKFYDYILLKFRENGYSRYEVSNFAKQGYESKHNLTYWHDEEYIGVGVGSSGFINNIRYKNSSSLTKYIKGIRDGEKEEISLSENKKYFLICNLRLEKGFSLTKYNELFFEDFLSTKKSEIFSLINSNLLKIDGDYLKATDEGIMLLDMILEKLI